MHTSNSIILTILALSAPVLGQGSDCAPGGNFDLSIWKLQLPTGSEGSPDSISSSELSGCDGYEDDYFFTNDEDASLVMKVPGSPSSSNCVTTPNSDHCRTELRESDPSKWSPSDATNRLFADLVVTEISDNSVAVGQIHIDDSISTKPVCELYYGSSGKLEMGINTCTTCSQERFDIGNVPVGQRFTYEIRYESDQLSVSIDGGDFQNLDTFDLDSPDGYFKAGNYNQGEGATEVHFYAVEVTH